MFTACLKEPERVVQYNVDCIHCSVKYLDGSGNTSTDTIRNGFLFRFQADVKDDLLLDATSFVNDPEMSAYILVDTEETNRAYASGTPPRVTIDTEVPKRDN